MIRIYLALPASVLTLLSLAAPPAVARYAWTGAGYGSPLFDGADWSNPYNWQSNSPAVSGVNTTITFAGAPVGLSSNNIYFPCITNSLTFNVGMTLAGLQMDFRANSGSVLPQIVQSSGSAVTIANDLALTNNLTITGAGGGLLSLSGALTGPGSLNINGSYVAVNGNLNTYTGGTNITNGGRLVLGASNALPSTTAVNVTSGTFNVNNANQTIGALTLGPSTTAPTVSTGSGALTLGGDVTFNGGLSTKGALISGNVNLGGATRTISIGIFSGQTYDVVVSAVVSGAGGLTQAGSTSGAIVLNAANSYTGDTTVSAGNMYLGVTNALPASTNVNVVTGASLYLNPQSASQGVAPNSYNQTITTLSGDGTVSLGTATLNIYQGNNFTFTTFTGVLSGGTVIVDGPLLNSLTLTNFGNTSNFVVKQLGHLDVNTASGGSSGCGALGSGALTLNGGTVTYTGATATCAKAIALDSVNGGNIEVTNSGTVLTLSAPFANASGSLGVYGPGTLALTAASNRTGATYFNSGALRVGADGALGASTTGLNFNGGTLQLGASFNIAATRAVILTSNGTIDTNGFNTTINQNISGAGQLTKAGAGILTLAYNVGFGASGNTYSGGTLITGGTLAAGAHGTMPAGGNITAMSGATFDLGQTEVYGSAAVGTVYLNGGTFHVGDGSSSVFELNAFNMTGGSIIGANGSDEFEFRLDGATGIVTNASAVTSTISIGNSFIYRPYVTPTAIYYGQTAFQVALGTTANGVDLDITAMLAGQIIKTGNGVLRINTGWIAATYIVNQGKLRVDDPTVLNQGAMSLTGGTFQYHGPTASIPIPITLDAGVSSIEVSLASTTLTVGTPISGVGGLSITGAGNLVLPTNSTYQGGTIINGATFSATSDGNFGISAAGISITNGGTLVYPTNIATGRIFTLDSGGTIAVAAGQTLTLAGARVNGGFFAGPGTFAVTGGTALNGVTTFASSPISVTGSASFTNFTNGGPMTAAAGPVTPITLTRFTNQGSGSITIGANSQVNVSDFETYGLLTLTPALISGKTLLTNTGTTPLYFNGGSRTFIGVAGGNAALSGIELNGQNAVVAGGLFVNNGQVTDGSAAGNSTVIADYGALVKGGGQYDNSPITRNGGKFQAGNSPGVATVGRFVFGPGGVSNYIFAIDNATGTAGPTPDALGHVSGWGLVKAAQWQRAVGATSGDFVWTADTSNRLTVAIDTLVNPTTVGTDVPGLMADFDPTRSYSWPAVEWTGTYSGPTDVAALDAATNFDTSGFANPINGTFGWDLGRSSLSLSYTPSAVPEPGTLALTALAGLGWIIRRRR